MTDIRKRQPKGLPTGGEFAANAHDEAHGTLGTAPSVEVLEEDTDWADEQIAKRLRRSGFTDGYIEMSREHYRPEVERMARARAEAHAPMRAYLAGEPHPSDADFESMWEGEGATPGFGRIDVEQALAGVEAQRGQGEEMDRALDAQETFWKKALETRGRSLGVNQSIVLSAKAETSD